MVKGLPKRTLIGVGGSFLFSILILITTGYGIYTGKLLFFNLRRGGPLVYLYSSGNQISFYLVIVMNLALSFFMGYVGIRVYRHEVMKIKRKRVSPKTHH